MIRWHNLIIINQARHPVGIWGPEFNQDTIEQHLIKLDDLRKLLELRIKASLRCLLIHSRIISISIHLQIDRTSSKQFQ